MIFDVVEITGLFSVSTMTPVPTCIFFFNCSLPSFCGGMMMASPVGGAPGPRGTALWTVTAPDVPFVAKLQTILKPYPSDELEYYDITPKVNAPKNNTPENIKPL